MQIILIGAGQLGSRHLQAICKLQTSVHIDVVDLSSQALEVCKQRFEEVEHAKINATFLQEIPQNKTYNLAIIATASRVRAKVTEELIEKSKIQYILFEKVLFTLSEDYSRIQKLLEKHAIKAWVNCPRRMYPIYKNMAKIFEKDTCLNFVAQGGDWGLACNSIHFIDLVSYFTKEKNFIYLNNFLDKTIHESKREGYKELTGSLLAKGDKGSIITLSSVQNSTAPLTIQIWGNQAHAYLGEHNSTCTLYTQENRWKAQELPLHIPYQSELTNLFVEEIMQTGTCELTTFEESCALHTPLLEFFIKHMQEQGFSSLECPIT